MTRFASFVVLVLALISLAVSAKVPVAEGLNIPSVNRIMCASDDDCPDIAGKGYDCCLPGDGSPGFCIYENYGCYVR